MNWARGLGALALLGMLVTPALGDRLLSAMSNDEIDITSSFDGENMTFFGSVVPDAGAEEKFVQGPFQVIVVVLGPTADRTARQMTRNFGVWLNTDQVIFRKFPSYFRVLASDHLTDITDVTTLTTQFILPEAHMLVPNDAGWWKTAIFGKQLIRLMTEQGLFGVNESGVSFLSDTTYAARLTLPSNAPPGPYIALTYVFKDGAIIARKSEGFAVRKIGFERFLALASVQQPLLYGIVCVILALFTGWLGGVLFKR